MYFLESIKHLINLQRFFRIFTGRWEKKRVENGITINERKLKTDKFEVILSILNILIVWGALGAGVYVHFAVDGDSILKGKSKMMMIIAYVELGFTMLQSSYLLIIHIVKRKEQIIYLEKLNVIDDQLEGLFNQKICYKRFYKDVNAILVMMLSFYLVLTVFFVLYLLLHLGVSGPTIIFTVYMHQSISNAMFSLGYYALVRTLWSKLRNLNKHLKRKLHINDDQDDNIAHVEWVERNKFFDTCISGSGDVIKYTKLYKKICFRIEEINQIFGFTMVLSFAHDFTLLTIQAFVFLFCVSLGLHDENSLLLVSVVLWMFPNIVKISVTCVTCHRTRNEANLCSKYLKKFCSEEDVDLKELTDIFSLQSIHAKIEFSANDYFPIDMTLLFSSISAAASYVLILIQFKNYEDET